MSSSARWTIVVVLLVPAVVLPLLVGVYDRTDPELWGFPFYYWFQFLLIPVVALFTTAAYWLTRTEDPPTTPTEKADDPAETIR
jgi:CBS domain containing-hemolysin-like protein